MERGERSKGGEGGRKEGREGSREGGINGVGEEGGGAGRGGLQRRCENVPTVEVR